MQRRTKTQHSTGSDTTESAKKSKPLLLKPAVLRPLLVLAVLISAIGYYALEMFGGGSPTIASEQHSTNPAVVELFTSQGCYSCPPAEALLGDLIEANDLEHLVALEFHVDYWDSLVYGKHGSHKDPFSSPENTLRQQMYRHADLTGQSGVYTPQMVVNGRYATVGSMRRRVLEGIRRIERPPVKIDVIDQSKPSSINASLRIELTGDFSKVPDDTHVWIAVFDIKETTAITTGENHEKTLTSHHMVRQLNQLSPQDGYTKLDATGGALKLQADVVLSEGQGCAVLLQGSELGTIHGASYCPTSFWKPKKVPTADIISSS